MSFSASAESGTLLGGFLLNRPDLENHPEEDARAARKNPQAVILLLRDGTAPVREDGDGARLHWIPCAELLPTQEGRETTPAPIHLGTRSDGAPAFLLIQAEDTETSTASAASPASSDAPAAESTPGTTPSPAQPPAPRRADPFVVPRDAAEHLPENVRRQGLREAAATLGAEDAAWLATALALAHWHRSQGYCPSCGAPTEAVRVGWARRCSREGKELFPRTDPAVIAAVTHTDAEGVERLLLGHACAWPEHRYSTFAGFVEAGEPLEGAVVREVREESGARVVSTSYFGSQPWPFPRSLMLGFRAEAATLEDARADGIEMGAVEWFTREELDEAVASGRVILPSKVSIAHHLIADWYGGALPRAKEW